MIEKLKSFDVAIYIFILSCLGYLITFLYQWGYYSYFNIPIEFIELSISNITKALVITVAISSAFLSYSMFFFDKTDLKGAIDSTAKKIVVDNKVINFSLQFLCVGAFIYLTYLYNVSDDKKLLEIFFQGLIVFLIYSLLKRYMKMAMVTLMFISLLLPPVIGKGMAEKQETFYRIDIKDKSYFVLGYYDKRVILGEVNLSKKEILPRYKFPSLADLSEDDFKLIRMNNLTVKEIKYIK